MSDWFAVGNGVRQGCRIAPDPFLGPMNHMMERTVHRGMTGVGLTIGNEVFTDLDFADDVSASRNVGSPSSRTDCYS